MYIFNATSWYCLCKELVIFTREEKSTLINTAGHDRTTRWPARFSKGVACNYIASFGSDRHSK